MPGLDSTPARSLAAGSLESRFSRSGRMRSQVRRAFVSAQWRVVVAAASAAKRSLDVAASAAILIAASPLFATAAIRSAFRGCPVLARETKAGRWCEDFEELSFAPQLGAPWSAGAVRGLPVVCNVLRGEMSFVGPRAARPGELSPRERQVRRRYDVRPGVICLWWVRRRANIAYESEAALDGEYVESHGALNDLGIALRAAPAIFYGQGSETPAPEEVRILGIRTRNLTMAEAIEWIHARLAGGAQSQVCFVNPDCANISMRNAEYRRVLDGSELVLADGIGLKIAGKLLGTPIKQNVNGTDLFPRLMQSLEGSGRSVYLLGARPGVADLVAEWIRKNAPGTEIAGARDGYFREDETGTVTAGIRASGAGLLLVAFGAPRQDVWIAQHLRETGVQVAMGVGGLFDFYSGRIPRAPVWMREIGMEWLYRFAQEPRRMWKRYFVGNAVFLFHVWRQRSSRMRA
jgi:N-acetylglucosaminyldiphosphoundecaprenol N-acetyl-beta-D-mannosaminyltransferase